MITQSLWILLSFLIAIIIVILILWIMDEVRAKRRYVKKLNMLKKSAEMKIIG